MFHVNLTCFLKYHQSCVFGEMECHILRARYVGHATSVHNDHVILVNLLQTTCSTVSRVVHRELELRVHIIIFNNNHYSY